MKNLLVIAPDVPYPDDYGAAQGSEGPPGDRPASLMNRPRVIP